MIRRALSIVLPAALALSLVACTEAPGTSRASGAESHDRWNGTGPWAVSSRPTLVIGMLEGAEEYQFSAISAAARHSDGDLVVADEGARVVRLYGPDGRFRVTLGQAGSGPGEFTRPTQIVIVDVDSVMVWDDAAYRLSVFDSAGAFVRDHTFNRARITDAVTPPLNPGSGRLLSSGDLLVRLIAKSAKTLPSGGATNRFRAASGALRVSADASLIDTVAFFKGAEQAVVESPWGRLALDPPLPRNTWIAVQPNEPRACIGDQENLGISCYETDGTVIFARWPNPPSAVRDDDPDVEEWRSRTLADYEMKLSYEASIRLLEQMSPPAERPPHSSLVLDHDGYLWADSGPAEDPASSDYLVFDRAGSLLGTVRLPRMRILEIDRNEIIAAYRDELDVQYLGVFEVTKPESPAQEVE